MTGDTDEIVVAQLVISRRAAQDEGDVAAAAMCEAGLALYDSGCRTLVTMPGGGRTRLPVAVAATAAKLAAAGRTEAQWLYEFTRLILEACPTGYPAAVIRLITSCIREQQRAGLWPWK